MARAHSIFILRSRMMPGTILGAWTVKRELSEWLASGGNGGLTYPWAAKCLTTDREIIEERYEVLRLRDGKGRLGDIVPWSEIL